MTDAKKFDYTGEDPVVQEWLDSQVDKAELEKLGLQDQRAMMARGFEFGVTGSGRPAFHGDTIVHEGKLYVDDVLKRYGFDDPVVKMPMYSPPIGDDIYTTYGERHHRYNTEKLIEVPDQYATMRSSDGKILGTVGNSYRVVQTPEAFAFLNTLVEADRLIVEAAVSLKGGSIIALTVRRPENVIIAGEEVVPYLNALNGFDGKTPIVVLASPVRQVCLNTVRLSFEHAASTYKVRHTTNALRKLQLAREALQISFKPDELDAEFEGLTDELRVEAEKAVDVADKYTERLQQIGNDLAGFKMNNRQFDAFLKKLVPITDDMIQRTMTIREDKRAEIRSTWMSSENLENIRNTRWGALQAVVEYTDHIRTYRSADTKVMSILKNENDNQRAYELLAN